MSSAVAWVFCLFESVPGNSTRVASWTLCFPGKPHNWVLSNENIFHHGNKKYSKTNLQNNQLEYYDTKLKHECIQNSNRNRKVIFRLSRGSKGQVFSKVLESIKNDLIEESWAIPEPQATFDIPEHELLIITSDFYQEVTEDFTRRCLIVYKVGKRYWNFFKG